MKKINILDQKKNAGFIVKMYFICFFIVLLI